MKTKKCILNALRQDLAVQEVKVMDYIIANSSITSTQLMKLLNIKKRRAQVVLGQIVEDRLICKKGASRNKSYVLME